MSNLKLNSFNTEYFQAPVKEAAAVLPVHHTGGQGQEGEELRAGGGPDPVQRGGAGPGGQDLPRKHPGSEHHHQEKHGSHQRLVREDTHKNILTTKVRYPPPLDLSGS